MAIDTSHLMRTPECVVAPNGLTIVSSRLSTTPMVQAHLAIPVRFRDAADLAATDVMSAIWTDLPASRELENIGGAVALARRRNWLILSLVAPRRSVDALFDVLRAVTSSKYSTDTVAAFSARCRQQSEQVLAHPGALTSELMWTQFYGLVPTSLASAPDPSALAAVDTAAVEQAHRRQIRPDGSHLVIVGDVNQDMAVEAAIAALASWSAVDDPAEDEFDYAPVGSPTIRIHHRPALSANHVRLLAPSLPTTHPDAFTVASLASLVLGGNFSSRLNRVVRETSGLAYRTMSMLTDHGHNVVLSVEADVARGKCGAALELVSDMMIDLATAGPTDRELDDAIGFTTGSHELTMGSQYGRSSALVSYSTMGLGIDAIERLPDELATITTAKVREVFEMFTPLSFWGVVSGPDDSDVARGEFHYE